MAGVLVLPIVSMTLLPAGRPSEGPKLELVSVCVLWAVRRMSLREVHDEGAEGEVHDNLT